MSDTKEDIYFSFKGGRQRQITKGEWEQEWLRWWQKIDKASEDSPNKSRP